MQIYFLGTNGWFASKTGETTCILIKSKKYNLILDAGSGLKNISKLGKIKIFDKPIFIFLSHLHLDHIEGIHSLSNILEKENIIIFIHKVYKKKLNFFFNSPFTKSFKKCNFVKIKNFSSKNQILKNLFFSYKRLKHLDPSFGFRFIIENKIISYCTDTSDCKSIDKLAKNCDLLIIESNNLPSAKKSKFHLSASESVSIGHRNHAKKIALIHFDPVNFNSIKKRNYIKKLYPKNNKIIITKDKMRILL